MKQMFIMPSALKATLSSAMFTLAAMVVTPVIHANEDPALLIDPRIGTVARLLVPTHPTFHLPHQMIRMYPIASVYHYIDDQIWGFPLQVMTHREKGVFSMKVVSGDITPAAWKNPMINDRDLEDVHPWFYSTKLVDAEIAVGFSPGKKAAIYRVDFPANASRNFLFQGTKQLKGKKSGDNSFYMQETYTYTVKGEVPFKKSMTVYSYAEVTDLDGRPVAGFDVSEADGKWAITLGSSTPASLLLKYAISYLDENQAKANFMAELVQVNLEQLKAQGKKEWDKVVGQIEVTGATTAQKRAFYTALYRTNERMLDINEGGRYFSGYDGKIHSSDRPFYVDDWVWDTYRAMHPLKTVLSPDLAADFLHSYTEMYKQSGWLPTFPQVHGNHNCMNAYHSILILVDAYRKGIRGFDVEAAYEGSRKSLLEATWIPWRQGTPKTALDDLATKLGYYPALRPGEKEWEPRVDGFEKRQSVAISLGKSYDAWGLAQWAHDLGKSDDYTFFKEMSDSYKTLWHPERRLFMPKDEKGAWIEINPKSDGGPGYRDFYDENNGWTYAWDVAHDIAGLTQLLGGKKATEERLDQLFREPLEKRMNQFYIDGGNSTGMVGQFSMGNEPSLHIPYIYNYVGAPWKTQKWTRRLLDLWFNDDVHGMPGDEDGGGMSAFVVFTSLGFYPVTVGSPYYAITSPIFEKSTLHLANQKTFTIEALGASTKNKYIQKAMLNGQELDSAFISHSTIMAGGVLRLEMSDRPNKSWAVKSEPPSHP